mmetsp:Transcript_114602/g.222546  ORF Transcript_114602/g.222546 Transcript_114602/m.222546 type:complete len:238 (-) Transcript_114602:196-909(-)
MRSFNLATSEPCTDTFTTTLFLMFLALLAYFNVFSVSPKCTSAGEIHAIIKVLLLPPKESCSSRVSLESRYGTCERWSFGSPKAEITLPSASSPWLILTPSRKRSPTVPVFFARSEPARSAKRTLAVTTSPELRIVCSSVIVKIAWDRELLSFMLVEAVVLNTAPFSRQRRSSDGRRTSTCFKPVTITPCCGSSRIVMGLQDRALSNRFGSSRSLMSSLCNSTKLTRMATSASCCLG